MSPHVAGTTPYPWPYDGDLAGPATALVVLATADGRDAGAAVAPAVRRLAEAVHQAGGLVVRATVPEPTRAAGRGDPPGRAASTGERWVDHDLVAGGLDAFYASDLDVVLRRRGVRRLLLAGVGLETAVHSTMRDANDRGYECLLVVDACAPIDPALVPASVSMVEMSGGIFGAVGRVADVVAALAPAHSPTTEGALR